MLKKYPFFISITVIYAALSAFLLNFGWETASGSAVILLTLGYLLLGIPKLGGRIKLYGFFLALAIAAIGISITFGAYNVIQAISVLAALLLMLVLLVNSFYDDSKWGLGMVLAAMVVTAVTSLSQLLAPITHGRKYFSIGNTDEGKKRGNRTIWLSVLVMVPIVAVVLLLLSTADVLFKNLLSGFFDAFDGMEKVFPFLLRFVFLGAFSYAILSISEKRCFSELKGISTRKNPAAVYLTGVTLALIYVIFSTIQIWGLFLKKLTLPENVTYAQYAREGFFQLLAVCIINLVLILICLAVFERTALLKVILTIITFTTYILILSSGLRMYMYVSRYGLSILRMQVFWALSVLLLLFVGVLLLIYIPSFPLFRYALVCVTLFYLIFAYMKPAAVVTRYNWEHREEIGEFDARYVVSLGADAHVEVLSRATKEELTEYDLENRIKKFYNQHYADYDSILSYNYSVRILCAKK